jgi:uncharacterized protein (UPF0332 family)
MREQRVEIQEHVQTAWEFLAAADREFAAGDALQASEKLWGAASHAVIAIAQQRGWPFGKHRNLGRAVQLLYEESRDGFLLGGFKAAEMFHANFYHDFMEDFQVEENRPLVREFVDRMLYLVD